jgi:hypothetical protein
MAEDPTRGLENNAVHARAVYLSTLRPLPTPMLLKEYNALMEGIIGLAPPDFLEAFERLVKTQKVRTPEA